MTYRPSGVNAKPGIMSRVARDSSPLRSIGRRSHRSTPSARRRTFSPVRPSDSAPYTSSVPSGESSGRMAFVPSVLTGSLTFVARSYRMIRLIVPFRDPYGLGVTEA